MKSRLLSIALLMGLPTLTLTATEPYTQNQSSKPDFKLITLPYSTDALAPVISQKTIELHHGKHLKGYVDQGNKLLRGIDLWEHAYYLDYNNRRSDHLKALWSIIDWSIVSERLQ